VLLLGFVGGVVLTLWRRNGAANQIDELLVRRYRQTS
jgi:hypothetical protein